MYTSVLVHLLEQEQAYQARFTNLTSEIELVDQLQPEIRVPNLSIDLVRIRKAVSLPYTARNTQT